MYNIFKLIMFQGQKTNSGFTFIELLIILLFLTSAALTAILIINPKRQRDRAIDTKKISSLDQLGKALEEFYNDHECYPKPQEICYTGGENGSPPGNPCFICGKESTSPNFSPYLNSLPCDPYHPLKKILYKVDNITCPSWFKIFIDFQDDTNPNNLLTGCSNGGCGTQPKYGYDYGLTSPNTTLEKVSDITLSFYCYRTRDGSCPACGTYQECQNNDVCGNIYPTRELCQTYK